MLFDGVIYNSHTMVFDKAINNNHMVNATSVTRLAHQK